MSRRNVPLVLAVAIDALGAGIFAPLSLLYFVRVADLPLPVVGALATAGAVLSLSDGGRIRRVDVLLLVSV